MVATVGSLLVKVIGAVWFNELVTVPIIAKSVELNAFEPKAVNTNGLGAVTVSDCCTSGGAGKPAAFAATCCEAVMVHVPKPT